MTDDSDTAAEAYVAPRPGDRGGPLRYWWWLVRCQRGRVAAGSVYGSAWMVALALPPYLLARAVDDGLRGGSSEQLRFWVALLAATGVAAAWLAIMRHRTMTRVRLDAAFRTTQVIVRQAVRLGAVLPRRVSAGEVVQIGFGDVGVIAQVLTITGPGVGAVVAYGVVAVLVWNIAPLLAVVVLLGVPLLVVAIGPLLGRLQKVADVYRERQGEVTARFTDMADGLRVLNGIGGKEVYAERYRHDSRRLRDEGFRVGAVTSWIGALGAGLPALFLGGMTWLAARMAAQGEISVGELTAVFAYAAMLVMPVSFLLEGLSDLGRGLVAARRLLGFLALEPAPEAAHPVDAPTRLAPLHDPASGVEVTPGVLTALVASRPSETAAVVDRLGRLTPSEATWGGTPLARTDLRQVRERVVVADNDADLFAGTLREVLAGRLDPARTDEKTLTAALRAAAALDVVRGLPHGLDSAIDAQGRNLSGGQRQRVRLARALLADSETLLAVEPTSAVDAHTEAAMAHGLRTDRAGRTTVVTSTSPLVLDQADVVHFLVDGRVAATGTHRELLHAHADYRRLVARDADPEEATPR